MSEDERVDDSCRRDGLGVRTPHLCASFHETFVFYKVTIKRRNRVGTQVGPGVVSPLPKSRTLGGRPVPKGD